MAVTVEQFRAYVGTKEVSTFVDSCLSGANQHVAKFVGSARVPNDVLDMAVLSCASELFHRRSAPNGVAQFADLGTTVRIAKDPMNAAREMLLPFTGPGL
ncbi:MAG: hypothetical protein EBS85_03850 [Micrococcales bacterium]|jgi:hypothetical protein|nr:hypothetical protein [Actinomycetota bacterium]NCA07844.1 hypothetical protein [Micrococcales bacterium]